MSQIENSITSMAVVFIRQRHGGSAVTREEITRAVRECASLMTGTSDSPDIDLEALAAEIETRLVVKVGKPTTLVDQRDHVPWYFGDCKSDRRFFRRYSEFLLQDQGWPAATVETIDEATDLIMEQLEDPQRSGVWDRRGLVVGHVQSGKTANYAGLINKAADAGYKLIIVLAGMHNVLRQQTQRRLDRDVLGYDTTPPKKNGHGYVRIGVGELDGSVHAEHLTTQAVNGDFSRRLAENLGIGVQQRPVLLVVKKNAKILENLNNWVSEVLTPKGDTEARPLLLVDDEADQASVDTGEQVFDEDEIPDPDYEPKRINGQIRRLLNAFTRSAYVAYTATPFANVLIHDQATADGFGDDLFPRSFIVNLPAPSNYVGPRTVFGIDQEEDEASEGVLDVIRTVKQEREGWIRQGHKKTFTPRFKNEEEIPPSLQKAVLSFVLACAARAARGKPQAHNSMLVHVSRFKDVHQRVFGQLDAWLSDLKRALRYRTGAEKMVERMRQLWEADFEPTSAKVRNLDLGKDIPFTLWSSIEPLLADVADRIRCQVVNSDLKEGLPYEDYEKQGLGLNVIAVGGDKLSRGLTLEGLTVSYFLRPSKMYDSLMQMGRWFGYRPGYADLCRLYLTSDLQLWFRHVATAAEELRDRLDHMASIGSTPEQYGLRIQSHEILMVTAQNKMRHSREFQISFQGEAKIQTVFFRDRKPNEHNAAKVVEFLETLGRPVERNGQTDWRRHEGRRLWKGVPGLDVADLLGSLNFPEEARDVNGLRLSSYVREQLKAGELTEWTIAVQSGRGESRECSGWLFATIERKPLSRGKDVGRYVVKTILSPRDEAVDLSHEEYAAALAETNRTREKQEKPAADKPDGVDIRKVRGQDPRRALLLLYPLSPSKAELSDLDVPVFGIVVSFPDSESGRAVRYRFNTVEQRFEILE
ncbi:Z1 domain-containing protein [Afifella sp. H1R]|uniref:Z1 domain-containing protein n=1 Tax=Afifella sp. H1R TaxID=2908841 RepID=UPI001F2B3D70|nr:Z1 domain-containing protein [Afifella sp. H1R]MCF1504005.1 Z1 domain-containing protein [Afifella sp. H1R]